MTDVERANALIRKYLDASDQTPDDTLRDGIVQALSAVRADERRKSLEERFTLEVRLGEPFPYVVMKHTHSEYNAYADRADAEQAICAKGGK